MKARAKIFRGENRSDPAYTPNTEARNQKRDYGKIIKKYRELAKVSQGQVSQDLGYCPNQLCYWETGTSTPRLDMVVPLCNYLHIPIDEFLGVSVSSKDLSIDETQLIYCFRKSSEASKTAILQILADLSAGISAQNEVNRLKPSNSPNLDENGDPIKRKRGRPRKTQEETP